MDIAKFCFDKKKYYLFVEIWLGNNDNSPMNKVTGGGMPAKTWREFNKSVINEARRYKPYESDGNSPKSDSFWDKFL